MKRENRTVALQCKTSKLDAPVELSEIYDILNALACGSEGVVGDRAAHPMQQFFIIGEDPFQEGDLHQNSHPCIH